MLKRIILASFGSIFAIFLAFFSFDVSAQFGGTGTCTASNGSPFTQECGATAYTPTGNCSFSTGAGNGNSGYACEYCREVFYQTRTCNLSETCVTTCTNDPASCPTSGGTQQCYNQGSGGGCYSNSDCPHPPDTLCDTYCTGSGGTVGYCTQVDPACGSSGGGPSTCGNGVCDGGENSTTCPGDCTPVTSDFALDASPSIRTIQPGGSTTYTITVSSVGTFTGSVSLAVSACPTNATCNITATTLRPPDYEENVVNLSYGPQTATLSVYNTGSTPINDYSVTVSATGGGDNHSISPILHVIPAPPTNTAVALSACPARNITISWTAGNGATSYGIYRSTSGTIPAAPFATTVGTSYVDSPATGQIYNYWVQSLHAASGNSSAAVSAGSVGIYNCPPSVNISANGGDGPLYISHNTAATIAWTGVNVTSCTITSNPSVTSGSGTSGSQSSGNITVDTTFTATCTGPGGTASDSVLLRIPPNPSALSANCPAPGTTATFSWTLPSGFTASYQRMRNDTTGSTIPGVDNDNYIGSTMTVNGLVPGNSYSWWMHTRHTATGAYSQGQGVAFTCGVPSPVADIKANGSDNPATIFYNTGAVISWTSSYVTSCTVSSSPSAGSWSGTSGSQTSENLTSNTTTFTLSCSGPSGSASDTVQVRIPPPPTGLTGTCPVPGTSGSISWSMPSGYTESLVRAYDTATTWSCAANQLCTGPYTGSSISFNSSSNPPMVPGHAYAWWIHSRDSVSGAVSQAVAGSFSCVGQAAFSLSPTTYNFSGTSGGLAPAGQTMTITNSGTAQLNYTITTNRDWCRVNGVNNTGSVTGSVAAGATGTVTISVDTPSVVGSFSCTVTVVDPSALVTTRTAAVNYVVNAASAPTVDIKGWGPPSVPQSSPVDGPIAVTLNSTGGLVWTSTNATNCEIFRGSTSLGNSWPINGSAPLGGVTTSDTHSIVCYGPGGTSNTDSFTRTMLQPTISLNPTSFSFSGTSGGATPAGQTMAISNTGNATLNWSFSRSGAASWCSVTPSSGSIVPSGSQNVTVSVSAPSTIGSFSDCGIIISDTNASNNPRTASITYTVTAAAQSAFTISPTTMTFTGISGGSTPSAQILTTTNTGTAALNYTVTTNQNWCRVNGVNNSGSVAGTIGYPPANGTQNVAITVDAPSTVGTFNCTVTVSAPAAAAPTSRTLTVTYTVSAMSQPAFSISPTTMSFSGAVGSAAPAQQILQIISNGTADVWFTATSNQSWCKINGSSSIPGAVASSPPGQSTPVAITVDTPSVVGIGTHSCTITVTDPTAVAPTSRTLAVTYTVTSPYQAVCDSTWRAVPGGGGTLSQPIGMYLPTSPNIQNNNANVVVVRGGDSQVYYQSCNYSGGNPCVWNSTYTGLGGSTAYPLYNTTGAFWEVYHYGMDNNTYYKWNTSVGWQASWTSIGNSPRNWGQPFRWTDVNNRNWQIRKNSDSSISYYCTAPGGAPVCQPMEFNSARSSVSPSSVTTGGSFTARCDYDSSGIDAINATVTGGGTCTFASWDKTTAVFNCTAGNSSGSQTVTCSLNSGTSSNVCSQSNTAGTVTVSAPVFCNASAIGTNQFVGCVYSGVSFNTLTTSNAANGQTAASPADSVTAFNYTDVTSGFSGVPNTFSIRWKGNFTFTGGTYIFTYGSDDGMRVFIDDNGDNAADGGTYLVNDWNYQSYSVKTTGAVTVPAGAHRVVAEYFQGMGGAQYSLSWARQVPPANPSSVNNYNSNTDPVPGRTGCNSITITWVDNSTNETGFNIYKDGVLLTTRSASSPASGTGSTMVYTFAPGDTNVHTYSLVATGTYVNSGSVTASPAGIATYVCSAQLQGQSDKDLLSVNGNTLPASTQCNNKTDSLPPSTVLRYGDVITFQINLCNSAVVGGNAATNVYLFDTLTNLQKPSGGWNVQFYNGSSWVTLTENVGQQSSCPTPSPSTGQYTVCGASPNQSIIANISSSTYDIPPNSSRSLKIDGQISLINTTTTYGRIQNKVDVCYRRFVGDTGTCNSNGGSASFNTPLILFYNGIGVPDRKEQP